jgi:hypothetical protein
VTGASPEPAPGERRASAGPELRALRALGWLLLAGLVGFAALVHRGIGPAGTGFQQSWYEPTGFFFESELFSALLDPPGLAFASLGGLAALLAAAVLLASGSALAKALALSAVAAVLLFLFYGLFAPSPWQFFAWRGSAALVLVAHCFGFAAAAPALAESWLRLSWPARIAVYLPFAAFAIGFVCNTTGTDPELLFAISPWPVVSVFGLETCALFLAAGWIGTAIAVAGMGRAASRGAALLALLAGLAVPGLLLLAGSQLGLLPFGVRPRLVVGVAIGCALAIAAAATLRLADRGPALQRRARRLAVGAALVALPLCAGQAWAFFDYQLTREVRAQQIIDALADYVEREELYPETLAELVQARDLDEVPQPSIGIGPISDEGFRYQSFGTSYLLEFTATRWVQCAYTPAPIYEEDEDPEEYADEDLGESWSCPSRPPELW